MALRFTVTCLRMCLPCFYRIAKYKQFTFIKWNAMCFSTDFSKYVYLPTFLHFQREKKITFFSFSDCFRVPRAYRVSFLNTYALSGQFEEFFWVSGHVNDFTGSSAISPPAMQRLAYSPRFPDIIFIACLGSSLPSISSHIYETCGCAAVKRSAVDVHDPSSNPGEGDRNFSLAVDWSSLLMHPGCCWRRLVRTLHDNQPNSKLYIHHRAIFITDIIPKQTVNGIIFWKKTFSR